MSRIQELIGRLTLEEKVGQLFVLHVYGHSATAPDPADAEANEQELGVRTAAELVARYRPGGVIYFSWAHNTRSPEQIAELSNALQGAALAQPSGIPLLISTDQEHGAVARVGAPATLLPAAMALGAHGSRPDAWRAARVSGAELRALGIHQPYAPVADVNVNPANPVIGVRSFGAAPQAVAALVTAQVEGLQAVGAAATCKHFPGHGDTALDSHTALPYVHCTREEWEEVHAPPFRAAVAAGVDSVMTAHVVVPALDPSGVPATLSRPVVTGILREQLAYDGVVVTDALGMRGVRTTYGDDRVPVLALRAGADQLLNPPRPETAWNGVLRAVREGELTEARIDESLRRILRLKEKLGLLPEDATDTSVYVDVAAVADRVGTREHRATADAVAERTTTLLRNDGALLPLSPRTHARLLVTGADPASPSGTTGPPTAVLASALSELGFTAKALPTGTEPDRDLIAAAATAARGADAAVITTYNVTDTPSGRSQAALVAALAATGTPVITLAVRNPYDAAHLPDVPAALAAFSWTDVELRAAARVIAGRARPVGRLPVPVPCADDPEQVLYPTGHGLTY